MADTSPPVAVARAPCFLSYARDDLLQDQDGNLLRFLEHLEAKLRAKLALGEAPALFRDNEAIPPGAQWRGELLGALQGARVFVPLYSSTFFTRPYCGKEWQLFRMRQERYLETTPPGTPPPARILPLLWNVENLKSVPGVASEVHYAHDRFGANDARYGLAKLMELTRFQKDYEALVEAFSTELVRLIQAGPALPSLPEPPPLDTIPNAFAPPSQPRARPLGPRSAQFLFVAAKAGEMMPVRGGERGEAYNPQGGRYWKPFHPPIDEEVGILAQGALYSEKLHYDVLPLDGAFIGRLQQALNDRNIVVVIIDPWTLQLDAYKELVRELDDRNFWNTAILFPRDESDEATRTRRGELAELTAQVFVNKSLNKDPDFFLDVIVTKQDFERLLAITIAKLRSRILQVSKPRPLPPGSAGPSVISSIQERT